MQDRISEQSVHILCETVMSLQNAEECRKFFDDLCTIAELKAMSQRIEVAMMLSENMMYNEIAAKTGASSATISRVKKCLDYGAGGYQIALKRRKKTGIK